jgi:dihydroxy-acid dehydratase
LVVPEELEERRRTWKPLEKAVASPFLRRYRRLAQSAAKGAAFKEQE